MITLKLATSLDGKIATLSGESQWITGQPAREEGHRLRGQHDAVIVGIGTVLADDPMLTVRLPGYDGPQPARVVLDSHRRLPRDSRLAKTAGEIPTYLVTSDANSPALANTDLKILVVLGRNQAIDDAGPSPRPDISRLPQLLEAFELRKLMIEGGGQVAASFLKAGLVDRIEWFRAPIILGDEGRPAIAGLGVDRLSRAPAFKRVEVSSVGEDLWERYERT